MKYDDILYKERPHAKFPMSLNDRAKIFLPFAALKGYEELIEEKNRKEIQKIELSQDALEELDEKLHYIQEHLPLNLSIVYFDSNAYQTITGECTRLDIERNEITIKDISIALQNIYDIEIN